ncbi:MAG TPA: hypothetical protein VK465_07090 [Fibrobacteria bacterium]|nr:hypothetical protein [Fibrobacteria bacterium]
MAKDAKTRAKARALYEAGQSFREVAQAVGTSFTSVKLWAKKDGWEKGKAAPKIAQKEEAALEREAERHGLTKARVLAKVAELIDANSLAVITTQGAVSLCPMLPTAKAKDGKGTFMGIDYDVVPDRKTQLEAAKLAADVMGMKKVEVDASEGFRSFFQGLRGQA